MRRWKTWRRSPETRIGEGGQTGAAPLRRQEAASGRGAGHGILSPKRGGGKGAPPDRGRFREASSRLASD